MDEMNNVNMQMPAKDLGETLGLVGMILGIASFFVNIGVLPIAGMICSYLGRKRSLESGFKNTYAMVGLILNGIQLGLLVVGLILLVFIMIIYIIFIIIAIFAGAM